MYARDCVVGFRSEGEIAGTTQRLRLTMGVGEDIQLDVVQLIEKCVGLNFGTNGALALDIFIWNGHSYHAYMSFAPLIMHIEDEVWTHAKWGDPKSRFILAHELGHAILHDKTAKPFSIESSNYWVSDFKEQSAEWQADTFANNLLAPDWLCGSSQSADIISRVCNIELVRAQERMESLRRRRLWHGQVGERWGDICLSCANFTLVRNGTCLKCETCGATTGCS